MKNRTKALSALALIFSSYFSIQHAISAPSTDIFPGATLTQLQSQYPIHWVSVEQISASLKGKEPISVGFDIDDTLLYSSPAFFYGKMIYSPDSFDFLKNPKFWDEVSNGWDKFSVPKISGAALLNMHLSRGDRVYFITGRPMPSSGKETVTKILQQDFNIPDEQLNKVIFAGIGDGAKVSHMKEKNISIFYGDSDNDIADARAAGAEGIRVLRPLNSTNKPMPKNGDFGEKVVINSDY
ncbi:acid phosphatase [Yersinia entomophaga]|uniref:Class B acid phosphatase n=1 Tax=Yersinia entomophaga TaxID=935293 RepID=A0ABN4PY37_YERET|nr:acid phosphatase AphA [Yersinia entomophaga]ANI31913.1 acid phosphatase [Yersinia entomophaga]OWF86775.1 acid phosphatase/phosphotransferase [Yersinia entomophaga]